jgi:hypothetical protein
MALSGCHSEREAAFVFTMEQAPLSSIDEAAEVAALSPHFTPVFEFRLLPVIPGGLAVR